MGTQSETVVTIADLRLIERLQRGDPAAFQQLWGQWRDPAWTACRAMTTSRDAAVALLTVVYRDLPRAVRGWDRQTPPCCLFGAHVFATIHREMELPPIRGIEAHIPPGVRAPSPDDVRHRLGSLDPAVRLVYVADLFFGCASATLSGLVGVDEQELRNARTAAAYALVAEGGA